MKEHITDGTPCWCNPDIETYKNGERVKPKKTIMPDGLVEEMWLSGSRALKSHRKDDRKKS